jgi:hypothetical protein
MSTFKTILLSTAFLAGISVSATSVRLQTIIGPDKIYGPKIIASSSRSAAKSLAKDDNTYMYTVELNQTSAYDTTVSVTDVTASAQPIDYAVVIPAGYLSASFDVVAANPGEDLIVATNANRSASMEVTVL